MSLTRNFAERLRESGIRPSAQRIAVYSWLYGQRNHPTAEMIYQALAPDFPMLSRTTVYNTLKLFIAEGVIQPVLIEDGEMRFDADLRRHGHCKCRKCGAVYDLFFPEETVLPEPADGFRVEETHLYYRGLCADCASE